MPGACGFVCGTLPHSKLVCTPSLPSPQLVGGGSQLALPLSFCRASPQLLALFLACVWAEVSLRPLLLVVLWHSSGVCICSFVKQDDAVCPYSKLALLWLLKKCAAVLALLLG